MCSSKVKKGQAEESDDAWSREQSWHSRRTLVLPPLGLQTFHFHFFFQIGEGIVQSTDDRGVFLDGESVLLDLQWHVDGRQVTRSAVHPVLAGCRFYDEGVFAAHCWITDLPHTFLGIRDDVVRIRVDWCVDLLQRCILIRPEVILCRSVFDQPEFDLLICYQVC